jgi:hypothetical protein
MHIWQPKKFFIFNLLAYRAFRLKIRVSVVRIRPWAPFFPYFSINRAGVPLAGCG